MGARCKKKVAACLLPALRYDAPLNQGSTTEEDGDMKLGLVTYDIAKGWDCDTLIATCTELGYEGVELRTTHAHGVEVSLTRDERSAIRRKFADSPVALVGLGSIFEYHAADPAVLRRNIDGTKEYVKLAADVGAEGVKVRPNAFPAGVPKEQTIDQIGESLRELGAFAADHGVKIRLEVHGAGTSHPPAVARILTVANHPNVYACWNSNKSDIDESGSIDAHFRMLQARIQICHINALWNDYPWVRLFTLLRETGFSGFCLAEIPASSDPETVLRYYRKLFLASQAST
jgi:sugar phosphate isomerase/epimerase